MFSWGSNGKDQMEATVAHVFIFIVQVSIFILNLLATSQKRLIFFFKTGQRTLRVLRPKLIEIGEMLKLFSSLYAVMTRRTIVIIWKCDMNGE